jgi:hypothetical protein
MGHPWRSDGRSRLSWQGFSLWNRRQPCRRARMQMRGKCADAGLAGGLRRCHGVRRAILEMASRGRATALFRGLPPLVRGLSSHADLFGKGNPRRSGSAGHGLHYRTFGKGHWPNARESRLGAELLERNRGIERCLWENRARRDSALRLARPYDHASQNGRAGAAGSEILDVVHPLLLNRAR